ncbi:MAG TPA: TIM-barrel domain-containing protein [Dyella sp.]|uniref:glycoside hydrolase family 31 protein n=1 Tax=Dyella sp. TaxID=1869338 RepID=UPI002F91E694
MTGRRLLAGSLLAVCLALVPTLSATATSPALSPTRAVFALPQGSLELRVASPNILRISYAPNGVASASTPVVDPAGMLPVDASPALRNGRNPEKLATTGLDGFEASWDATRQVVTIVDRRHKRLLAIDVTALIHGRLAVEHAASDALYGIGGTVATDLHPDGLLRSGKRDARAGEQGNAGAPFVWSTAGYGVLADVLGAHFDLTTASLIQASGVSAPIHTVYVFGGAPSTIFRGLAQVSGHGPLFPKWAMGFTNSQWSIDEPELLSIVKTYRAKQIPLDNITLDFDWKAWGDDHYGEFRWNESKFPDGPSGKLKRELDAQGVHLTGIMKPRVHVDSEQGRYASEHGFWLTSSSPKPDYFSHKIIRELDFANPAVRAWFFNDRLRHAFDTGIVGWWNDEADTVDSDIQFMGMQRALYDGQRAYSDQRVWSINRNFYLGSQRYAYAMWSGDILTGFESMKAQRARMLAAVDVGATLWGMDGGGFQGQAPSPENYARWIQFGAFTPIFRVHGTFGQKRQPWVYGPVAERAATDAIRLRYSLIPYIYAYEHVRATTGVGLVRPLIFDWPDDRNVRDDVDAWMFGDYLLVSPVVEQGQASKDIYLPAGTWTDFHSGKVYAGGQTVHLAVDSKRWSDIPLFVRDGAIVPTQPVMNYVDEKSVTQLDVDMFPGASPSEFTLYDDDGRTYAYEKGAFAARPLKLSRDGSGVQVRILKQVGSYKSSVTSLVLKLHGIRASAVTANGKPLPGAKEPDALRKSSSDGWVTGTDRFGEVTYIRIGLDALTDLRITGGART